MLLIIASTEDENGR